MTNGFSLLSFVLRASQNAYPKRSGTSFQEIANKLHFGKQFFLPTVSTRKQMQKETPFRSGTGAAAAAEQN